MTPHWIPHPNPVPTLGTVLHIESGHTRRRVRVVGSKPGHILITL